MQKYHLLYIQILSWYSNTCVTKWIYEQIEYLFQPYIYTLYIIIKESLSSFNYKNIQWCQKRQWNGPGITAPTPGCVCGIGNFHTTTCWCFNAAQNFIIGRSLLLIVYNHMCTQYNIHTLEHMHAHARTRTHTYTQTNTHTYTHTYIYHTYVHTHRHRQTDTHLPYWWHSTLAAHFGSITFVIVQFSSSQFHSTQGTSSLILQQNCMYIM